MKGLFSASSKDKRPEPQPLAEDSLASAVIASASQQSSDLVENHKRQLADQISRLQERHMALVQQAADELESLKHDVSESKELEETLQKEKEPLFAEINQLRLTIAQMQKERERYLAQHSQMQAVLDSLKNLVRSQARTLDQQIRVFSLDSTQSLESMLDTLQSSALPAPVQEAVQSPVPQAAAAPVLQPLPKPEPLPAALPPSRPAKPEPALAMKAPRLKKEKKPRPALRLGISPVFVRGLAFCLLLGVGGYVGWQKIANTPLPGASSQAGKVAGASTDSSITQTDANAGGQGDYAASYNDIPFDQSIWETTTDPDFLISMQYPTNATSRVRNVGSDNLFFLRKNGIFFKLTKHETTQTLEQWWADNKDNYTDDYAVSRSTFKNQTAYFAQPITPTDISGHQYFLKKGNLIYQVWILDKPASKDDEKRLKQMVDSLQFTTS